MSDQNEAAEHKKEGDRISLLKVLGPAHVWALGVGIVLVGEYMGYNFSIGKGGALGSIIACWFIGLLYTCVAMIDSEVTSTVAAAGGQYSQAKHIIGPLMAFNVGLYLVFAYTMLEAADALVVGDLMVEAARDFGVENLDPKPFVVFTIAILAWLNYRGVFMTLTVNFIITAIAFIAIFVLFFAARGWSPGEFIQQKGLLTQLPYGWLGVVAAFQFAIWYYLGIEGTCQAAEEVRSVARSLPLGTMTGMMTLLIAATMTWYLTAGLVPWEYLGVSFIPQYDAARAFGNPFVQVVMFIGTLFSAVASANGTINDAARAWFSMGRDSYLPTWFGAVHPKYRTPYRSILFLVPVAISFGFTGLLDQVMINMFKFRRQWPLGTIRRGYIHPYHPAPAVTLFLLCCVTYFATFLGYGVQLLAMMTFYIAASIWFHFFRYKFVKRGDQFQMSWPRPQGY
jgi:ethanolamine permease